VKILVELKQLPTTDNWSILKLPIEHAPVFNVILRSEQLMEYLSSSKSRNRMEKKIAKLAFAQP